MKYLTLLAFLPVFLNSLEIDFKSRIKEIEFKMSECTDYQTYQYFYGYRQAYIDLYDEVKISQDDAQYDLNNWPED